MQDKSKYPDKIFGGEYSEEMWNNINNAKSIEELTTALYFVCCRLQELESKLTPLFEVQKKESERRDILLEELIDAF